jgi:hypothetical protein
MKVSIPRVASVHREIFSKRPNIGYKKSLKCNNVDEASVAVPLTEMGEGGNSAGTQAQNYRQRGTFARLATNGNELRHCVLKRQ